MVEKKSFKPGYLSSSLADGAIAKGRVGAIPASQPHPAGMSRSGIAALT